MPPPAPSRRRSACGWSPLGHCYVSDCARFSKPCHWSALAGRSCSVEPLIANHAAGMQWRQMFADWRRSSPRNTAAQAAPGNRGGRRAPHALSWPANRFAGRAPWRMNKVIAGSRSWAFVALPAAPGMIHHGLMRRLGALTHPGIEANNLGRAQLYSSRRRARHQLVLASTLETRSIAPSSPTG